MKNQLGFSAKISQTGSTITLFCLYPVLFRLCFCSRGLTVTSVDLTEEDGLLSSILVRLKRFWYAVAVSRSLLHFRTKQSLICMSITCDVITRYGASTLAFCFYSGCFGFNFLPSLLYFSKFNEVILLLFKLIRKKFSVCGCELVSQTLVYELHKNKFCQ